MKLSRLGAGTSLAIVALLASLASTEGACSADYQEPCGVNGVKNGVCQVGTCPSGSVELEVPDPSDSCPASNNATTDYVCCVPSEADAGTPGDAGNAG